MCLFAYCLEFLNSFRWPKIKLFDPLDITVLESDDDNLYITHDLEVMESEFQSESDSEEVFDSFSKDLEQYEEKSKPNLEETEVINIGTETEIKEVQISIEFLDT